MRRLRELSIAAALAAGIGAVTSVTAANATTYTFTNSNFAGTGNFGTVDVTGNGTTSISFDVKLAPGFQFWGGSDSFGFSLQGNPTITYGTITDVGNSNANPWSGTGPLSPAQAMDGYGKYSYIVANSGSGGSGNYGTEITFTITSASVLNLITDDGNTGIYWFAVHLYEPGLTSSNTGYAGAVLGTPGTQGSTPLPAAWPLFGSVLGGGYLLSKWRRRQRGAKLQPAAA
jgi:hypothetical protein